MALFGPNRHLFREVSHAARQQHARRVHAAVFALLAVGLLAVSRIDPTVVAPFGQAVVSVTAPIAAAASGLVIPAARAVSSLQLAFSKRRDLEILRAENARLTSLAALVADLERDNQHLRRATNYIGYGGLSPQTARVIASSSGPLSRTVVINAGRNQGVEDGAPVVTDGLLTGRVIDVQSDTARVMLLADRLSRVPVQIGVNQVRAVLTGTGSEQPILEFIASETAVNRGDLVTTSGLGGVFPRGLVIGTLLGGSQRWSLSLSPFQDAPTLVAILSRPMMAVGPAFLSGATPVLAPVNAMAAPYAKSKSKDAAK